MDIHDFDNNLDSINNSHDWQSDLHTPSDLHDSSNLSDYSDTGNYDSSHDYNFSGTDYSNDYHSYHNDSYSDRSSFGDTYSSTHETNSLYSNWDDRQENSFQHRSIESNLHQNTWETGYHSQYASVNEDDRYSSTAENHFQQTSWETEAHSQYASPRSVSLNSQDVEKAHDLYKQAEEKRSVADYRMNAAKEFADKNSPDVDSVNKYLDKAADALKDAEKHEAEANKILEGK